MQVLAGPRQVGKTTVIRQVLQHAGLPASYATADEVAGYDREWIRAEWTAARAAAGPEGAILVLDEVQKIPGWSDMVKFLWDEDTFSGSTLKVFILGSAPLLVGRGLTESLAGRFEVIRVPHWSLAEMRAAFGFDLDRFLYFGGYPARADDTGDEPRWMEEFADHTTVPYRRRRVPLGDVIHLLEGIRAASRSVLSGDEQRAADAGIDGAIRNLRWHRRLAGDARRRNPILAAIYKGG